MHPERQVLSAMGYVASSPVAPVLLALVVLALGVGMIGHSLKRHERWGRYSTAPLPWWKTFLSYRLPRENVSERDIEQEGTVAEGLVGVLLLILAFGLWHFRHG
jgi:uncharacterized membrane protein